MTSIGAVGSAAVAVYPVNRVTARASDSAPTPTIDPAERVNQLTRQLDASLTGKLTRIREQISTTTSGAGSAEATPRRLDLRA